MHRTGYILIVLSLLIVQVANAQTVRPKASNYVMPTDVQAVGGGETAKSTFYRLDDTIGEANIGAGRSDNYDLQAGYRQTSDNAYIAMNCDDVADMGTISFTGQANGSATCTVTTDADAGYSLSWRAGTNNTNGLVGHWKLDETTGTTAYDTSGNGNNGGHQSSPTISSVIPSNYFSTRSLDFDGSTSYVEVADAPALDINDAITIAGWVNVDNSESGASNQYVVDKQNLYSLFVEDNEAISFYGSNLNTPLLSTTDTIGLDEWHHVAATYDRNAGSNNAKIYIDGVLRTQATRTGALGTDSNPLRIGCYSNSGGACSNSWGFDGNTDDIRVYNRALSGDEIHTLASKAPPGALTLSGSQVTSISPFGMPFTGGLVGHWKFDEIPGGGDAADSSGYGNSGTPAGASGTNNKPQPSTTLPASPNHITLRSMDFDGTDDRVEAADSTAWDFGTGPVTMSAWVKFDTVKSSFFLMQKNGGSNGGFEWWYSHSESAMRFSASNATEIVMKSWSPSADTWYQIAYTRSGNVHTLYVNGQSIGSTTDAAAIANVSGVLRMGARDLNGTYELDGKMDDVRVYSRALTAAEIAALYGTPQTWTVANTDARWGARLSSTSTDVDVKWGTDNSSDTWLNVGEGSYPLVVRSSRTAVSGSTEVIHFRSEIGATKIQAPGVYKATILLTAAAL